MGTMFSRIVYPRSGEPEVQAAAMPLKTIPAPCAVPLDNEVVHTSGNENIYGIKFFRDQVYVGDSSMYTSIKSNGDFLKSPSGVTTVYTYSLPASGGTLALQSETTGHATTADVELNQREPFSEWSLSGSYSERDISGLEIYRSTTSPYKWYISGTETWVNGWDPETETEIYDSWNFTIDTGETDPNATFLFGWANDPYEFFDITATRTGKHCGYILGPTGGINSAHPVASANYEKLNKRPIEDWVIQKSYEYSPDAELIWGYTGEFNWIFVIDHEPYPTGNTNINATAVSYDATNEWGCVYTATRTKPPGYILGPISGENSASPLAGINDTILNSRGNQPGYTLGTQSDKPIAAVSDTILNLNDWNNWVVSPSSIQITGWEGEVNTYTSADYTPDWGDWPGGGFYGWWVANPYDGQWDQPSTSEDANLLTYSFTTNFETYENSVTITATRSRKPGYILGTQTTKPIPMFSDITVGTLNTTASGAQSTNASESLSGSVTLHKVSKTGDYNDLLNKPTIPDAQIQSDWNQTTTTAKDYIKNKPTIPSVTEKADSVALAPAFSSSSTYAIGSLVTKDGRLYRCKTAISTASAWDSSKWVETTSTTNPLPYDAEIEYLESTGGQKIETGIIHNTANAVRFKFKLPSSGSYANAYAGYTNESSATTRIIRNGSSTTIILVYHGGKASGSGTQFTVTNNTSDIYEGWTRSGRACINGTEFNINAPFASTLSSPIILLGGSASGGRIYRFSIDGQCDYIPVRIGQVGYIYDRMSGTLIGNTGTGSFNLGADVQSGSRLGGKAEAYHTHVAADITQGLATVAKSGSYNDLSNKPTIPDITGKYDKAGGTLSGNVTISYPDSNLKLRIESNDTVRQPWIELYGSSINHGDDTNNYTYTFPLDNGVLALTKQIPSYTFSTGLTDSSGTITVTNPVPAATSADQGKVLSVADTSGTLGWVSQSSGGSSSLSGLSDVVISSVSGGQVLAYDSTSLKWINTSPSGGDSRELRYAIVTPSVTASTTSATNDTISTTLQDRAINIVSAGSGIDYVNMTFPEQTLGYARDFFVRLILTGSEVPTVSFIESGGGDVSFDVDDDSWEEIDLGVNILMFTETSQEAGSGS